MKPELEEVADFWDVEWSWAVVLIAVDMLETHFHRQMCRQKPLEILHNQVGFDVPLALSP